MNAALHWFTTPEWAQVVQTLLHSLWQGALIAAALTLGLRRLTSPQSRYRCSLIALAAIPLAGIGTLAVLNTANHFPPPASPDPQVASETAVAPEMVALDPNAKSKVVVVARRNVTAPSQANWTAWLALAWLVGAGLMLGRAGIKVAGAEQLRRSCRPLDHPAVMQLVVEARGAVGYARNLRVAVTDKLTSPAVVGVLVPTLVLPLTLLTTLSPEQIRFILLHELAHIRRGDYFANLFQLFVEALLFFNPAVWWISHQVRSEREACCDALAIELSGAPADYARTLVHVAENALNAAPTAAPAFGGQREPASLSDRVQRLLVPGYRPSLQLTWRAMLTAFVLGAALLVISAEGTRVAVAQINKPAAQADSKKETSSDIAKSEIAKQSFEDLDDFKSTISAPDFDKRTLSDSERLGEKDQAIQRLSQLLPMRDARASSSLGNKVPLLFDLPLVGKLFHSQNANPAEADFLQLAQLSTASESNWSADNSTENLVARFQDTVVGTDLIQYERESGQLAANGNARIDTQNGASESTTFSAVPNAAFRDTSPSATDLTVASSTNVMPVLEISASNPNSQVEYNVADGRTVVTNGGIVRFHDVVVQADSIELDHQSGKLRATGHARIESPKGVMDSTQTDLNIYSNTAPAQVSTNTIHTSKGRRAILNELSQIRLDSVFFDAVPLRSAISRLKEESWRRDPAGLGVFIVFAPNVDPRASDPADAWADIRVTIDPPLTNVRLLDALLAVVNGASRPIRLAIEDNAVVISNGEASTPLFMREFQLNPVAFAKRLAERGYNLEDSVNRTNGPIAFRNFFADAGVDLQPTKGKSVFYGDRRGLLLVRATLEELDRVEHMLAEQHLLAKLHSPPPEINIKVQFAETSDVIGNLPAFFHKMTGQTNASANNLSQHEDILTEAQYRVVANAIDQRKGFNLLSENEVTTGNGRQAQMQTVEIKTIVADINPKALVPSGVVTKNKDGSSETPFITTNLPFGPIIDIVPTLTPDGQSIALTVIPRLTEFLGYEGLADPTNQVTTYQDGKKVKAFLPRPLLRTQQMTNHAVVPNGMTLVLSGAPVERKTQNKEKVPVLGDIPGIGRLFRSESTQVKTNNLLIFVTPTIVNPATNRASSDR